MGKTQFIVEELFQSKDEDERKMLFEQKIQQYIESVLMKELEKF